MMDRLPNVTFKCRVKTDGELGPIWDWKDITTDELFKNKNVILFSLPGAFTPTCSTYQLPGFEKLYDDFKELGVDDIYCMSVNDSFVMNAWGKVHEINNVKMIPDGSGEFTRQMGMLVKKDNLGFGYRSWRYAIMVNNGFIRKMWEEKGKMDNCSDDPYEESAPLNILKDVSKFWKEIAEHEKKIT